MATTLLNHMRISTSTDAAQGGRNDFQAKVDHWHVVPGRPVAKIDRMGSRRAGNEGGHGTVSKPLIASSTMLPCEACVWQVS